MSQSRKETGRPATDETGIAAAKDVTDLTIEPAGLGREGRQINGLLKSSAFAELADTPVLDGGARVALTAVRDEGKLHIQGRVNARLQLNCSRCLIVFDYPVAVTVDRFFAPGVDPVADKAQSEMTEDLVYLGEGPFSLLRMVEEELLLELPIKFLCQPDCKGLCDRCGADLNQGICACPEEAADGPFAVLSSLKTH